MDLESIRASEMKKATLAKVKENLSDDFKRVVEEIKKASDNGRFSIRYKVELSDGEKDLLKQLGYKIETNHFQKRNNHRIEIEEYLDVEWI